jgi:NADH-quinone oxidoreductase subunit L
LLLAQEAPEVAAATGVFTWSWLLIALPLASAAVLLLGGRRTDRGRSIGINQRRSIGINAWGHLLGCATPITSFAIAVAIFFALLGRDAESRHVGQQLYTFISVGGFKVDLGTLIDPLSISFALLITGVGSIIHVYSIGYMGHDPDRRRFFGYLNLFIAAMLLLVLGNDYVTLYVGWEGVGLASYLLIGFWYYKPSAAAAAKKAFVVNRVGDLGLSLAIMLMFATFGRTSFAGVFAGAGELSEGTATAIGLLLLLGACGKSAQVPLQSWLLDAMEGPTPVSALIHAATMVTAGVYLVTRSAPIYAEAPNALTAVAVVGAVTLLFGALIGCAKDDIKKVLAGSTMSQIGYMMLAAGLGPVGYAYAILHLLTHGFFKANLFLGAGSVMHAMNDEVDMRRYGGLRQHLPVTFATFALGYLAIMGIPPFAGFFSKDKIIEAAFAVNVVYGAVALLGAGITAFYMTRLFAMTFLGEPRWAPDAHPHESPPVMTVPLLLLAALSLVGGGLLYLGGGFAAWLEPVFGHEEAHLGVPVWVLTASTLAVILVGAAIGYRLYATRPVPATAPAGSPLTVAARRDLYGDAANEAVFMRPGQYLTRLLVFFDNRGVDGIVNGLAALIGGSAGRARRVQTGFVRSYALSMFSGAAVIVVALLLVRWS